jgi:streptogramin lyase
MFKLWPKKLFCLLSLSVLGVVGFSAVQAAAEPLLPTIKRYSLPVVNSGPAGIARGPDRNMWFTEAGSFYMPVSINNKIGTITPAGIIKEYSTPTLKSSPMSIVQGPDGNMWFTEPGNPTPGGVVLNQIGRITPTGIIKEYSTPTLRSAPFGITAGPDGNLWFTEYFANQIGRITPAGVIKEYPILTKNTFPMSIAAGSDGNIWFTEFYNPNPDRPDMFVNKIGRITPAGIITEYTIPDNPDEAKGSLVGITAGPDGNIWFTYGDKIGKITSQGIITSYPLRALSGPAMITSGAGDTLWFTEMGAPDIGTTAITGNKIGKITTRGVVTEYPIPTEPSEGEVMPYGIAMGFDGNPWFTEIRGNKVSVLVQ